MSGHINKYADFISKQAKTGSFGYPTQIQLKETIEEELSGKCYSGTGNDDGHRSKDMWVAVKKDGWGKGEHKILGSSNKKDSAAKFGGTHVIRGDKLPK